MAYVAGAAELVPKNVNGSFYAPGAYDQYTAGQAAY